MSQEQHKTYRVLMVTGIYPTRSRPHKGTFVKALVDSLVDAGHTVEVVHPRPDQAVAIRYLSATLQVFFKTLSGNFDIVHGHYGLWCLVGRMQWTTPVIAAYLGDDLLGTVTPDGGRSKKSMYVVRISQWLCHHVDGVTVKSSQMQRASLDPNAVIIPDGINFDLFQPVPRAQARQELGWDPEKYYVVFANNPTIPVKNFALAQAAVARLAARGIDAELVVANGLPQSTVMQYINASNALILPSIAEGSPNVVKEAMACNVPVVATDVGDVADVISNTQGCSVCASDPEEMATGLEKAFAHTERTTGREDIKHLDSAVIAHRVLALYDQATKRTPRGATAEGAKEFSTKDKVHAEK